METTQPQLSSLATYAPVRGEKVTPFSQQTVVLTKQDYIALKWEANYWRAQHARLVQREAALKAQVEELEAQIRDLNQGIFAYPPHGACGMRGSCRVSDHAEGCLAANPLFLWLKRESKIVSRHDLELGISPRLCSTPHSRGDMQKYPA